MATKTIHLTISFNGIVARILRAKGVLKTDKILLEEILRLFNETREEYQKGNKEIASRFFDLIC
jgi:hypothetical protein